MSDHISREATYPLAKKICDAIDSNEFQRLNFGMLILDWIDDIPAADVRPVVLCKDCVYLTHDKHGAWCFNNYEANLKDDDFCSHGKRKERLT